MLSLWKSSAHLLLSPVLRIFGMEQKPDLPPEVVLDLPPTTPQGIDYWCTSVKERHIARQEVRQCKVVHIRRYKKSKNSQHEYLTATVQHPRHPSRIHLRIERALEHVEENGAPVLTKEQQITPPPSPGEDISLGFWATWTSQRSEELPLKAVTKARVSPTTSASSSSAFLRKVGPASDVVRLWDPPFPLLSNDNLIETLDLKDRPLPLVYLAILANTVHDRESLYNLFLTQCYWYANMITRVIANERSIKKTPDEPERDKQHCYDKTAGTFWKIPIHSVQPQVVDAIQEEYRRRCEIFKDEVRLLHFKFYLSSVG